MDMRRSGQMDRQTDVQDRWTKKREEKGRGGRREKKEVREEGGERS